MCASVCVCVRTGHKMFMSTLAGHCPLCCAVPVRPSSTSFTFTMPEPKSSSSSSEESERLLLPQCYARPPSLASPFFRPSFFYLSSTSSSVPVSPAHCDPIRLPFWPWAKPSRLASPPGLALLYYCQWFAFGLIKCKQIEFFSDARPSFASLYFGFFFFCGGSTWRMLNYIIHIAHTPRCAAAQRETLWFWFYVRQ